MISGVVLQHDWRLDIWKANFKSWSAMGLSFSFGQKLLAGAIGGRALGLPELLAQRVPPFFDRWSRAVRENGQGWKFVARSEAPLRRTLSERIPRGRALETRSQQGRGPHMLSKWPGERIRLPPCESARGRRGSLKEEVVDGLKPTGWQNLRHDSGEHEVRLPIHKQPPRRAVVRL